MIDFVRIPEERMKVLKNDASWKGKLKKFVDIKIKLNDEISIEGEDIFHVMRVKEMFRAIGRGFDFDNSLDLLDEEYVMEVIELKDFAGKSRKRQTILKGRVIGTSGKIKKVIEDKTNVKIAIYGKTISIIGMWKQAIVAKKAVEMLLSGSMHNTVYRFLQRQRGI